VQFPKATFDSTIVSKEGNSSVLEDLDACVGYEVTVRALNEKGGRVSALTGNTTTEADGKYQTQIIFLCL
jgi:hypothetical protein